MRPIASDTAIYIAPSFPTLELAVNPRLELFKRRFHTAFGDSVGVVLQSYLRRTERDLTDLLALGARIRLCKGAYKEPPEIAFPRKRDVDASYAACMERLLERGNYPAIATHDSELLDHGIADADAELRRQILSEQNRIGRVRVRRAQRVEAPLLHRTADVGHRRLERRIDSLHGDELLAARRGNERLAVDRRRRADHVRHLQQFVDLHVVIGDAVRLEHIHVRVRSEDAIAQLLLEPGHDRERDDHRHHADADAERRDERDDGDERLLAFREQIAERDVQFERDIHKAMRAILFFS